mgnify:FL=1
MLELDTKVITMHTVNNTFRWSSIFGADKVLVLSVVGLVCWLLTRIPAMMVAGIWLIQALMAVSYGSKYSSVLSMLLNPEADKAWSPPVIASVQHGYYGLPRRFCIKHRGQKIFTFFTITVYPVPLCTSARACIRIDTGLKLDIYPLSSRRSFNDKLAYGRFLLPSTCK